MWKSLKNVFHGDVRPVCPSERKDSTSVTMQLLSIRVLSQEFPRMDVRTPELLAQDALYAQFSRVVRKPWDPAPPTCSTVYLFGVSDEGYSVCVKVPKFRPWVYVDVPPKWRPVDVSTFVKQLGQTLKCTFGYKIVRRKRMYGWVPHKDDVTELHLFPYIQLFAPNSESLHAACAWMENAYKRKGTLYARHTFVVSEKKVTPEQKFMSVHNLVPCGWMKATHLSWCDGQQATFSQLEGVTTGSTVLEPLSLNQVGRIVTLSFDIESYSHDDAFPDANEELDRVIYIGMNFAVYGKSGIGQPAARVMLCLGEAAPRADMHMLCYTTELELLLAFRDVIVYSNPDIVTGYNIAKFDCAYIFTRLQRLAEHSRFEFMGRILGQYNPPQVTTLDSAAYGENDVTFFDMDGRVVMDLFMYVKTSQKLSSYKLDSVAQKFIPDSLGKVELVKPFWTSSCLQQVLHVLRSCSAGVLQLDGVHQFVQAAEQCLQQVPQSGLMDNLHVHALVERVTKRLSQHSQSGALEGEPESRLQSLTEGIRRLTVACGDNNYKKLFAMYDMGPDERSAIAWYCAVDCDLPLDLFSKLCIIPNVVQMCQVTYTPMFDVVRRGQQIRAFNGIYRFGVPRNFVMNQMSCGWDDSLDFEGATVLNPSAGYYDNPVATLDFASLYPSIMQGHNLCYSSIVLDPRFMRMDDPDHPSYREGVQYTRVPIGGKTWTFVKEGTRRGILPEILENLLTARRQAKKDMKHASDPFYKSLMNGRQLALKVSCNSIYGFTGVDDDKAMYGCKPIAVSVTYFGRHMIDTTKQFVESQYGYKVIYGDTDSVMIKMPSDMSMEQCFEMGERMAQRATTLFPRAVTLEFEKVYKPYMLWKKKSYAGMKYEGNPLDEPKLDAKGIEIVRRDKVPILRSLLEDVIVGIMHRGDVEGVYAQVIELMQKFRRNTLSVQDVTMSKTIKRSYASPSVTQVCVVKKMESRRAFNVPRTGDRVPYVIVQGPESRVCERADHPDFVREHGLQLDRLYYFDLMEKPIMKILCDLPVPSPRLLFQQTREDLVRQQVDGTKLLLSCPSMRGCDGPSGASVADHMRRARALGGASRTACTTFAQNKRKQRTLGGDVISYETAVKRGAPRKKARRSAAAGAAGAKCRKKAFDFSKFMKK
ncbi:MAG: hypothetical protein L7S67_06775 [Flavobacteriales bacterium]|nr:hypothetical protein [Flavobacteriales bacterium]